MAVVVWFAVLLYTFDSRSSDQDFKTQHVGLYISNSVTQKSSDTLLECRTWTRNLQHHY